MKSSIGIIGAGFVGMAVFKGFSLYYETKIYDINPKLSTHSFQDVINSDIVFLCLPTPMSEAGSADLSILESVFEKITSSSYNKNSVFVIKSTIPIGTTKKFFEKYKLKIVHNPEFLTARTSLIDFITPTRTIIGGYDNESMKIVEAIFEDRFPGHPIMLTSGEEAELIKYTANCFFATKITFFNEMKLLSDKLNLDWKTIMRGILLDGRISYSHTDVPGHDGLRGFGGACFPKDINAMIAVMEENGLNPIQMKATWDQNKRIRGSNE